MHDFFYKRGFTIYPGKGSIQNTFRLANMGAITKHDITKFLGYLKEYVVKKDIKLRPSQADKG